MKKLCRGFKCPGSRSCRLLFLMRHQRIYRHGKSIELRRACKGIRCFIYTNTGTQGRRALCRDGCNICPLITRNYWNNLLKQSITIPHYESYPTITYHGYNSRRFGCSGSGVDYVYADTDGDIHNCPFCQRKLFSAFDDSLPDLILQMKTKGCAAYSICSTVK